MTRIPPVVLGLALLVCASVSQAQPDSSTEGRYLTLYEKCGPETAGRNIATDGVNASPDRPATGAELEDSIAVLERCVAPPQTPSAVPSGDEPPSTVDSSQSEGSCGGITPYSGGGGCWAIPWYIVACESGGSYTAQNASGAYGAYQIMPEHGCGTTPAEQDACAARLYAGGSGAGNWVCA